MFIYRDTLKVEVDPAAQGAWLYGLDSAFFRSGREILPIGGNFALPAARRGSRIIADPARERQPQPRAGLEQAGRAEAGRGPGDVGRLGLALDRTPARSEEQPTVAGGAPIGWWDAEPDVVRMAYGMAARVNRIEALGNGQVPLQAATAWHLLGGPLTESNPPWGNRRER